MKVCKYYCDRCKKQCKPQNLAFAEMEFTRDYGTQHSKILHGIRAWLCDDCRHDIYKTFKGFKTDPSTSKAFVE